MITGEGVRDQFIDLVHHKLTPRCRRKTDLIFEIFQIFNWDVSREEVDYVGEHVGYKAGWSHYMVLHFDDRCQAWLQDKAAQQPTVLDDIEAARARAKPPEIREVPPFTPPPSPPQPFSMEDIARLFGIPLSLLQAGAVAASQSSHVPAFISGPMSRFAAYGLGYPFTLQELRVAYRARAFATHPDRSKDQVAWKQCSEDNETLQAWASDRKK